MAIPEFTTEELGQEEWRDIPGYEGYYQASSLGRIRSARTRTRTYIGKILRPASRLGYLFVRLSTGGPNARTPPVHRMVLAAFQGTSKLDVNHIDCNKKNNRLVNLEYVTHQENMAHAVRNHLMPTGDRSGSRKHPECRVRGEHSKQAKLTEKNIRDIRAKLSAGIKGAVIAREYHVSNMLISKIKHGHIWKHVMWRV